MITYNAFVRAIKISDNMSAYLAVFKDDGTPKTAKIQRRLAVVNQMIKCPSGHWLNAAFDGNHYCPVCDKAN